MTNTIAYNGTIDDAAWEIAEEIRDYYTGNTMPRLIGFTENGDVGYEYIVHGGDVVIPVYNTQYGWTFGDTDGDPSDDESWTNGLTEMVAELIKDDLLENNEWERQVDFTAE